MDRLDTERILTVLSDWSQLPAQFQLLTQDQQKQYLFDQGYQRFTDLLAHITAWWERGMSLIVRYRVESNFTAPAVDVDEFNAQAVAGVRGKTEAEVLKFFKQSLRRFLELIEDLDDEEKQDQRIVRQIEMELIGHYQEHKIE